jgi:molecular chaperone GrpE
VPDENETTLPQSAVTGDTPPVAESAAAPVEQDPLELAKAEQAKLKDQLLRTLADFDNFRKRSRRELVDAERRGRDDLLKEFLPVFDNLDRASAHAETATDVKALADGIGLVMRQFADTLSKVGIERIAAVGQPFDPAVHEAVQQMETSDFEPGTIAAEVQAGYRNTEKLIRPALVVVAKAKAN